MNITNLASRCNLSNIIYDAGRRSIKTSVATLSTTAKSPSRVQQLYNALKSIPNISNSAASPGQCPYLRECLTIMNTFTLIDVGLHEYDLPSIQDSVCMSICSTTDFDISLFIVPVGGSLPLHDHQNMAVLSKLLSGTALCTSYTPLYPHHPSPQQQQHNDYKHHGQHQSESPSPFFRRSVQTKDSNSPSWFLTPSLWNLHAFHALAPHALDSSLSSDRDASLSPAEPAVMLDILLPPYHAPERRCVFFSATSHPIWLPTASVAVKRNEDASQNTPCRSGNSIGEEVEEWPWQKWVVKQVEEPSEVLPYLVQYTGDVPEQWEERTSRN